MNIEQATIEAKAEAIKFGVCMVVTYNQYDEAEGETNRFGYMAERMFNIVTKHEKIVSLISPSGHIV